ncbi:hypothetical protein PC129_g20337 [Phytophthora cactorum]|uniref:Uncharacterized protein n=1 Tax=Phytophthora cactorum TaxID=29920 RepID=A0A329RD00_9STRA|nr:hypothetical protein Pcac1_g14045 [Phytophthora cactorum]KAG2797613.1 hypothetical protein PC111_g21222 [Phytophthora cactorum]KAG2827644.1 hypothetical protein PC113_g21591 [Phytophthora cactorum]KAG2876749.1 hypothetical protein PC114_g24038 [Phytophthora cactorum]KAG2884333.1 hypothetical protein PC115_g21372 [Phytophthora cactorum]
MNGNTLNSVVQLTSKTKWKGTAPVAQRVNKLTENEVYVTGNMNQEQFSILAATDPWLLGVLTAQGVSEDLGARVDSEEQGDETYFDEMVELRLPSRPD